MALNLDAAIDDFKGRAQEFKLQGWPTTLDLEYLPAPHDRKRLRQGHGAVYVFALSAQDTSIAGAGRVLKVGWAGPNSNARFQYQHYSPNSAPSSLARSLLSYPLLWPWLGIDALDESTVRNWMVTHLDRANVYVPTASCGLGRHLELYLRARLGGSVYEGAA